MLGMTTLSAPSWELYESWAEAVAEFGTAYPHGSGLPSVGPVRTDREACGQLLDNIALRSDMTRRPPEGLVHSDYFWLTEASEVVGFLALRHELTPALLQEGGHIGYSVRPSRRREGHATRALAQALERARALGIDRALVTCDDDNEPSARTIERNGGALEDVRDGVRRYWITL